MLRGPHGLFFKKEALPSLKLQVAFPNLPSQIHCVTARIDLFAPATITVFASGATSLDAEPPHAIFVQDPDSGTVTLIIVAADTAASFSASSLGGATVAASNNTLVITGLAAQVNAALQSLEVFEPAGATTDTISLTATEPGELAASTAIAVEVASTIGPAFAAPPESLALAAWTLDSIAGLVIGDPEVQSLLAAGEGAAETLQLTLSVASGVLLFPGYSALAGIHASGIGSNLVMLTFTADQLAAVNALLADLAFAGPAGVSGLAYGLRNVSGPLGSALTSGNIVLNVAGTAGAPQTIISGADTVILGTETPAGIITVTGVTSDIGGIAGTAAIAIAPDASFQMPYSTLNLGGTSYDDGLLAVLALNEAGTLVIDGSAVIGNVLNLGSAGIIDFTGTLVAVAQAQVAYQEGLSLAAGAVISGDGALVAGNFSNAGRIFGPGTILAAGGETLLIAAAEISGGANLQVGAGGVLELGPISPLYGVFDATPLTIDAGVALSFLAANGADQVSGALGDNLDERGGVIVINSPGLFSGTIVSFAPGDRLIFPGLTGLTLLSITSDSFVVAGVDGNGNTDEYTIDAAYPAGATPFVYADNEGDGEVGLRPANDEILLGAGLASNGEIMAQATVAQPIEGLNVLLRSWTTQSLTLTLSAADGILTDGTLAGAALTLTAVSPTALDDELANLTYTANANAVVDELQITAASGWLAGVSASIPIAITTTGTTNGFGDAGQIALFNADFTGLIAQDGAPGEIFITGTADFADVLNVEGIGGTGLRIDAGGVGVFDGAAIVALDANVTVGDAGGAGFLRIVTDEFGVAGNAVFGGASAAAGSGAEIAGRLSLSGAMLVGASAVTDIYLQGALTAASTTLGALGTLAASGDAQAAFGALNDAGVLILLDEATATATSAAIAGTLILDGASELTVQNAVSASSLVMIGPDARLSAAAFDQTGGSLRLIGELVAPSVTEAGLVTLAGGTIIATTITLEGDVLAGFGDIEATSGLASLALAGATIAVTGVMDIGANIAMSGASEILLGVSAALELDHSVAGGAVSFTGANAVLTIDDLQKFTSPVENMLAHDVIDLVGVAPGHVTFAGGSIVATDANNQVIGRFALSVAGGQPGVSIVSDGYGGALITLGDDMPCFARGTRVLTPSGYRPVEAFEPGDAVVTRDGVARPIRWIGRRTMDLDEQDDQPIRFAPGSIGRGVPARPVMLSHLHAVFLDGVLVPALHLVNGATIRRDVQGAVTYYHIELDRHDIVLAEGMPVETYLDNGNRGQLYEERGVRAHCATACARLVTGGAQLARIRRRLHNLALEAGYSLTYDAGLRGAAAATSLLPRIAMRRRRRIARFTLPAGAETLALAARAATPADTDPDSEDRRMLGVCLGRVTAGAGLGAGWLPRAAADEGQWMAGRAELTVPPGMRTITLELTAIAQTWRAP